MNRILAFFIAFIFAFLVKTDFVDDFCMFYFQNAEYDNFTTTVNPIGNCCYINSYTFDTLCDSYEINIPEECNGVRVEKLGGFFGRGAPDPFCLNFPEKMTDQNGETVLITQYDGNPKSKNIETVTVKINIGKNIKYVYASMDTGYYTLLRADKTGKYFCVVAEVSCDVNNEYFYSKDGKLYDKNTNELVGGFNYSNENP